MDVQLTLLLEIQDLDAKAKELETGSDLGVLERSHFGIDLSHAAATLREKMVELEGQLSEPVQRRYRRIAGHVDRVVVPVVSGTCYGCFVSVPTATSGELDPNAALQSCEHCGRFLYFLH
jgi:predicted  nucleic acid-binding Zn-ribbon protein